MSNTGYVALDLSAMQEEVYDWAWTKGWEPDLDRPFADACALMHSEVSEALEAYRKHLFADATDVNTGKPEGVGSELADVLIRLLHYCKAYSLTTDQDQTAPQLDRSTSPTFGTECVLMHASISGAFLSWEADDLSMCETYLSSLYASIRRCCADHDIGLAFEYERKMAYNRTRSYRHGNRAM